MEFETTRVTKKITVEEVRQKVMNMASHCDEQTLANLYEVAYEHVLASRFDLATGVVLYDLYEHRPLTIEEIDAKRVAEKIKERSIAEVFEDLAITTVEIYGSVFQVAKEIGKRMRRSKG